MGVAGVGVAVVMLMMMPGIATAQGVPTVEDVQGEVESQIQNASAAADEHVGDAEYQANQAGWTAAEHVLDAYDKAIKFWPKSIPLPIPRTEVNGVAIEGSPITPPRPPNPENAFESRPEQDDKSLTPPSPAPPPDELRHAMEKVFGNQTNGTTPEENVTSEAGLPSNNETMVNATTEPAEQVASPPAEPTPDLEPESQPPQENRPEPLAHAVSEVRQLPMEGIVVFAAASIGLAIIAWLVSQARFVGRLVAGIPGVALFSRQTGPQVLQHPARARIHAIIRQNSGINSVNLSEATGLPPSSLRYHVAILQRENLIRVTRRGRIHHYHEAGGRLDEQVRAREFLFWRGRGWLASAILQHPGSSQQTVARLAGLPASRVCEYTKELAEAGLVRSERVGRCRRYFPTSMLEDMFASGQLPTRSL